jgi:hypothetical protein
MLLVLVVLTAVSAAVAQPSPLLDDQGALYDSIRQLDRAEVKRLYAMFPPNDRQEVWTAHLIAFLASHNELTHEQRDVVLQALGLVTTGIFNVDRSSEAWQTNVHAPLLRIVTRAQEVMPRELVSEAFFRLDQPDAAGRTRGPRIVNNVEACDCSTIVSHCEDFGQVCRFDRPAHRCFAVPSYQCGPFFLYACDGLCDW